MKADEKIGGYYILSDATTANSGRSLWTFASKNGKEYFIKRFLSPKYPVKEAPGSEKNKKIQREKCEKFESRQKSIMEKLKNSVRPGGNIVLPIDFFREGPFYYKVSEKIDVSSLELEEISELSFDQKRLLLLTITYSISIFHNLKIIHGDLKPTNILIKSSYEGSYVAKIIDFDDAYFEGMVGGSADDIIGDMVYYSPELWSLISKNTEKETSLTTKSDIFALGIIFCQYWCGDLPVFDRDKFHYLANAILENGELGTTGRPLPAPLETLILKMLSLDPKKRPSAKDIFHELKSLKSDYIRSTPGIIVPEVRKTIAKPKLPPRSESSSPSPKKTSSLRGTLRDKIRKSRESKAPPKITISGSKLKGKGLRFKKKKSNK